MSQQYDGTSLLSIVYLYRGQRMQHTIRTW